ncbi:MAG: insulinase family protein [Candidatus Kapaibacteriales bacterium]
MNRIFSAFIGMALFSSGLFAQLPVVDISNPNQQIPIDPSIRTGQLENGLKYYIKQNNEPEDFIEFRLAVNVGALQEDPDQNGLAHFTEHMLFNGTEKYPENELLDFLEKTGARFGADINAYTNFDETVYMIPISNEGDNLEVGVEILSQWAHKATFAESEIDKERNVIVSEYRQRRSAQGRVQEALEDITFYGAKHREHDIIGDTSLLQKVPYSAFTRFYNDWYIPQNQAVAIVGDIDVAEAEMLIKKYFFGIKNPANPRKIVQHEIKDNEGIIAGVATDAEMPVVQIQTYFKHDVEGTGTIGDYRRSVVDNLLATMMSMRLAEKLQSSNPPYQQAYGVFADDYLGNKSAYIVGTIAMPTNIIGGYKATLAEIYKAKQNGFTAPELERAKAQILASYEASYNKRDDQESGNLAMEYVRNFLSNESIPGIAYEFAMVKEFDKDITLDEVNKRFQKYITQENIAITLAAPEKEGIVVPTEDDLITALKETSMESFDAYVDDSAGLVLFDKTLQPGKITAESKDDKSGVTTYILSNGVTVKAKKTDFTKDQILFSAQSWGGSSLVGDADFRNASYADNLVDASGIGEFDAPTLTKLLSGKRVSISPYIGELTEGFSGSTTIKDFETMMQLTHMYFTDPAKNKEAYDSWKVRTLNSVKERSNNPFSALQDTVSTVLNSYHFRRTPVSEEIINSVDLDKAYNLYRQRFADADDFTFYFAGDYDKATLENYIKTYLATLPTKEGSEKYKDIGIKSPTGTFIKKMYKGLDDKAYVYMTINDKFDFNKKNNYDLKLLKSVINFALIERLREEKGGVYSPSVFTSTDKYPKEEYSVSVFFSCDPARVDELTSTVSDYYKELMANGTKSDNLEKFVSQEKTQHDLNIKENRVWLNWMSSADYYNTSVEEYMNNIKMVNDYKLDDIKGIANKYLKMGELKTFILYPSDYGDN